MGKKEQRKHTNCTNVWWLVHKEGDATPSVYCEVDGVVIDTKDVNAEKCGHYTPPVRLHGESTKERVEWFDRNFRKQLKSDKAQKAVSQRLNTRPDGSRWYLTPEYYRFCKSYEGE